MSSEANHPSPWSVIDALPSAILLTDVNGLVVHANPVALRVLKLDAPEVVGHDVAQVLAPLEFLRSGGSNPECAGCRGTNTTQTCLRRRTPRGDTCIGYRFSNGAPAGAPWHYAVTFRDISEWHTLREERDRLLQLAAVGNALPTLLHELKNPLAAVTASVELLIEDSTEDGLRGDLHAILSELRRMALGFEGIGAVGRSVRSSRHQAVDEAVREAALVMGRRAQSLGVHMRFDVDFMPLLPFDPGVLRAVVFNLVTNALHASHAGGTVVLHSRLTDDGKRFELCVVDNGTGMTAEVFEKCTQLFFTTKRSGSGIGLALCRQVADDGGGELSLESVPGFGTSITLRLPIPAPERPRPASERLPLSVAEPVSWPESKS